MQGVMVTLILQMEKPRPAGGVGYLPKVTHLGSVGTALQGVRQGARIRARGVGRSRDRRSLVRVPGRGGPPRGSLTPHVRPAAQHL